MFNYLLVIYQSSSLSIIDLTSSIGGQSRCANKNFERATTDIPNQKTKHLAILSWVMSANHLDTLGSNVILFERERKKGNIKRSTDCDACDRGAINEIC